MPVASHIPTPYQVLGGAIVSDKLNEYGNWIVVSCERERTPQDEATLQFIKRACNSHAALVEALEGAQGALRTAASRIENRDPDLGAYLHTEATKAYEPLRLMALAKEDEPAPIAADLNHALNRALNREIDRRDSKAPFAT